MTLNWKVHLKNTTELRNVLNLLLVGRETELMITRGSSLAIFFKDTETGDDMARILRESMGMFVEEKRLETQWDENVFLTNRPRYHLFTLFPFFVETATGLNYGERLFIKAERFSTLNPVKKRLLGSKRKQLLYRLKVFTPMILRRYFSKNGKQCITLYKGYPLILTDGEIITLINGGYNDGLLAI